MMVGRAQWVVVIEAASRTSAGPVDQDQLQRLLETLGAGEPIGLHSAERYAVQVRVEACDEAEALRVAVSRWRAAVDELGSGEPRLLRAEVLTIEEFDRDCRRVYRADPVKDATEEPADPDRSLLLGDRLLRQVFYDPLTRLPARGLFLSQLERALVDERPPDVFPVVVVLKLSGLELVNEHWGRSAGDEVLVTIAGRVSEALPPKATAGRVGGDELAVLLDDGGADVEDAVSTVLSGLGPAVLMGDTEVTVPAHAGIAVARPGQDPNDLLAQARTAALVARESSAPRQLFRTGMQAASAPAPAPGPPEDPLGYLVLLQRAAAASNEARSLEDAASVIAGEMCARLGWAVAHVYLVRPDGRLQAGRLVRAPTGRHAGLLDFLASLTLRPGEGLAGRVLETGQPAWFTGIDPDGRLPWSGIAVSCRLCAALAFPVLVGSEVVAVLELFTEHAPPPDDTLLEVLGAIGSQLGRVVERRRGQAILRASEDRLREAHALAQLGSWHVDIARDECSWTPELCDILGVPHDSPHTLDSFLDLVHPDDRRRVRAETETACRSGSTGPFDLRIVRPDGGRRWVSVRLSSTRDETDAVTTLYGTMSDVTQMHVAEEALRERERRLAAAEAAARLGSWERDIGTEELVWSDSVLRLWAADRPNFRPTIDAMLAATHPDDRERMRRLMASAPGPVPRAANRPPRAEGPGDAAGGHRANTLGLSGFDASTERGRAILESTTDGVWIIDATGTTSYVNDRMAAMLGWLPQDMVGKGLVDFLDGEARAAFHARLPGRRRGRADQFETVVTRRNGSRLAVIVAANGLRDDWGRYVGAVALLHDVVRWRGR